MFEQPLFSVPRYSGFIYRFDFIIIVILCFLHKEVLQHYLSPSCVKFAIAYSDRWRGLDTHPAPTTHLWHSIGTNIAFNSTACGVSVSAGLLIWLFHLYIEYKRLT